MGKYLRKYVTDFFLCQKYRTIYTRSSTGQQILGNPTLWKSLTQKVHTAVIRLLYYPISFEYLYPLKIKDKASRKYDLHQRGSQFAAKSNYRLTTRSNSIRQHLFESDLKVSSRNIVNLLLD